MYKFSNNFNNICSTVDLTSCSEQIFNNAEWIQIQHQLHRTASLTMSSEVDLNWNITQGIFSSNNPNGTYTHGYAVMNNTFGITASFQIDGSMDGLSSGSGVFCGTVDGSGTSY